jgi:hypothetical protein
MNRIVNMVLGLLLAASLCYGQGPGAPAQAVVGHGAFPVKVTKTLDSSKLKEGDRVGVETSGSFKLPDGTLVPKGSLLDGHVTTAKARSKGDPDSQLTVMFDKLSLANGNGKQLAIKGIVQAVFPPVEEAEPMMAGKATGAAGGGEGANVGIVNTKSGSNMDSNSKPEPVQDPKSVGVQGIHDLQLDNGVLTSKGKNVKLGNGVRMIVRVDILG